MEDQLTRAHSSQILLDRTSSRQKICLKTVLLLNALSSLWSRRVLHETPSLIYWKRTYQTRPLTISNGRSGSGFARISLCIGYLVLKLKGRQLCPSANWCQCWPISLFRLSHFEYLDTLPSPDKLRTPLHFTSHELEIFKGTNLYGATLDREAEWKKEWEQCRELIRQSNPPAGDQFTW